MSDAEIKATQQFLNRGRQRAQHVAYSPAYGCIVGMVDIVDCVTQHSSDWFEGPFGWVLEKPVFFDNPIPYRGAVGIFHVPRPLLAGTPAARRRGAVAP